MTLISGGLSSIMARVLTTKSFASRMNASAEPSASESASRFINPSALLPSAVYSDVIAK